MDGGWLYRKNDTVTLNISWCLYNPVKLLNHKWKDIFTSYFVLNVYANTSKKSIPFLNLYSVPTSSQDVKSWYHAKRTFSIRENDRMLISSGSKVLLWYKNRPVNVHTDIKHYELVFDPLISEGDDNFDQEILTLSLNTDPTANLGTVKIAVQKFVTSVAGSTIERLLV